MTHQSLASFVEIMFEGSNDRLLSTLAKKRLFKSIQRSSLKGMNTDHVCPNDNNQCLLNKNLQTAAGGRKRIISKKTTIPHWSGMP